MQLRSYKSSSRIGLVSLRPTLRLQFSVMVSCCVALNPEQPTHAYTTHRYCTTQCFCQSLTAHTTVLNNISTANNAGRPCGHECQEASSYGIMLSRSMNTKQSTAPFSPVACWGRLVLPPSRAPWPASRGSSASPGAPLSIIRSPPSNAPRPGQPCTRFLLL